jgi:hypothetical protein
MSKTRPQKTAEWKVEPLPAAPISVDDLRGPELVALLAAAYGRIRLLETQLSELEAGPQKVLAA